MAAAAAGGGSAPAPKAEAAPAEKAAEAPKAAAPVADAKPAASTPAPVADGKRVFSSPLARRLAKEAGLDLSAVTGTGPHGRVVKADIEKAAASGGAKPAAAAPAAAAPSAAAPAMAKGPSDDSVMKLFAEGSYELLPHDGMRKTIAARLTESTQTVPSYTVSMECELDALMKLRAEINASAPVKKTEKGEVPTFRLSVNDFIIKAMALALRDVPMANASWTSTARVLHKHSDVASPSRSRMV